MSADVAVFLLVHKVHIGKIHLNLDLVPVGERGYGFVIPCNFPFGVQETELMVGNIFGFKTVAETFLVHYVNVVRTYEHTHLGARSKGIIVLNHNLIALLGEHYHLIVDALEYAGLHGAGKLGLVEIVGENVNILRTHHHVHVLIRRKTLVHTLEVVVDELHVIVGRYDAVENVALANEVCNERVCRLVVDILRGTDLLNNSLIHNDYGVGESKGLLLIVGYVDEGDSEFTVHLLEFHLHILAHLQVQSRQRFVEQEHLRLVHDSPRDSHPLLLTSGKGIHIPLLIVGHSHHFQGLAHTAVDFVRRHFLQLEAEGYVVVHIQVRKEGVFLEHGVQRTAVRRYVGNILAFHKYLSLIRFGEACKHSQHCRLAAA